MRLYYSPGSCALSPHIVAREAGLPVELSKVTFAGDVRTTEQGENYFEVNPKGGYVPALRLDDGEVMAEGPAIIQYLADQAPEKKLIADKGTLDYYRTIEWVAFISTELHKTFSIFFGKDVPESELTKAREKLTKRFAYVNQWLEGKEYLLGEFSIADAYAYTILRWTPRSGLTLAAYPNLSAFMARMETRPAVQSAIHEQGLELFAKDA